jgi:hypothetical protein
MTEEKELSYPNHRQSWGILGIMIFATVVFSPLSLLLNNITGKEFSFLVTYLLSTGATFLVAHQLRKKKTNISEYKFSPTSPKILILITLSTIGIQTGITSPLVSLIPVPEFMKTILLELGNMNGVFACIAIVLAAPILEELIFRGIMLNGLLRAHTPIKAILISSILFGLVHLNPWQFISAFMIGIFSGWVYYKTKNLTLSIHIHFVNNAVAFGSMFFMDMDTETMIDMPLSEFYGGYLNFFLITLGALIVTAVSLYFLRDEITNNRSSTEHSL